MERQSARHPQRGSREVTIPTLPRTSQTQNFIPVGLKIPVTTVQQSLRSVTLTHLDFQKKPISAMNHQGPLKDKDSGKVVKDQAQELRVQLDQGSFLSLHITS